MALPASLARADGTPVISAWSSIPEPLIAELYAQTSVDAVTFDMQHGLFGVESAMRCIGAVKRLGTPTIVRTPVGDWSNVSRCLDFGADAIIAPMINNVSDAEAFAAAAKYPPLGARSYGPTRAVNLNKGATSVTYRQGANTATQTIAMIETAEAVENLATSASTDGIDALFVGPADLSLSLSNGAELVPFGENSIGAIHEVARAAKDNGKWAAIYCYGPEDAVRAAEMGFEFIALGNDTAYVANGLDAMAVAARG